MRVFNDKIADALVVNNATTKTAAFSLEHIYGFSIYAAWEGTTISGSIGIEVTVDGENWVELSSETQTINSNDGYLWNLSDMFYKSMRLTVTSDDANDITVTATVNGKGV